MDDSDLNGLYFAIGYVVMKWAFIEQEIAMCCARVLRIAPTDKPPRDLSRSVSFLRKSLLERPELALFSEDGVKLMDRISGEKDYRQDLAHSTLRDFDCSGGIFHFSKIKQSGDTLSRHDWDFEVSGFQGKSQRLGVLADDLENYTRRFLTGLQ